jgi:hypothetical protein
MPPSGIGSARSTKRHLRAVRSSAIVVFVTRIRIREIALKCTLPSLPLPTDDRFAGAIRDIGQIQ